MTDKLRDRLKFIEDHWEDKRYRDELQHIIQSNLKSKRYNKAKNL